MKLVLALVVGVFVFLTLAHFGVLENLYFPHIEKAYYLFSGIGGLAAIYLIVTTNHQVQRQIKKDIFLRNAEFIIDELYAHVIEISYHWAHWAWKNYALDVTHNGQIDGKFGRDKRSNSIGDIHSVCRRAHQNRTTLALNTLNYLKGLKNYNDLSAKEDMSRTANIYIEKFDRLIRDAKKLDSNFREIYENSFLAELRNELNKIVNPEP